MQKKIVLVHCLAGISRSPTMCISYVMRHLKMDSEDAYKYVSYFMWFLSLYLVIHLYHLLVPDLWKRDEVQSLLISTSWVNSLNTREDYGMLLIYFHRFLSPFHCSEEGILPMKEVKDKLDCSPLEASSRPVSYRSIYSIYNNLSSSELLSCTCDENAQIFLISRNFDVIFKESNSEGTVDIRVL